MLSEGASYIDNDAAGTYLPRPRAIDKAGGYPTTATAKNYQNKSYENVFVRAPKFAANPNAPAFVLPKRTFNKADNAPQPSAGAAHSIQASHVTTIASYPLSLRFLAASGIAFVVFGLFASVFFPSSYTGIAMPFGLLQFWVAGIIARRM